MSDIAKPKNRLLAALPKNTYQQLFPKLQEVVLTLKEVIYQPGDVIRHIYFPESGIISLLSAVEEHSTLEVGVVGNEGMIGLPVFLGAKKSNNQALVQGAGIALKMKAAEFQKECRHNSELSQVLQRFTLSLITQISQSAVCNRYHRIDARLARWLLMMHDRILTDSFQITQEFLSNMLGVRREAVSKAATDLQHQQLIGYSRGNVLIINRKNLEGVACECYKIIKNDYQSSLQIKK